MIDFTESAVSKIKELMEKEGKVDHGLRVLVIPGGCSGLLYDFAMEKEPTKNDIILNFGGLKVFIDKHISNNINGSKIDYIESFQESGFKVQNPNAKSMCHCGKSFC